MRWPAIGRRRSRQDATTSIPSRWSSSGCSARSGHWRRRDADHERYRRRAACGRRHRGQPIRAEPAAGAPGLSQRHHGGRWPSGPRAAQLPAVRSRAARHHDAERERLVLSAMKADEHLPHIAVTLISAVHEIESVIRCIELGAEAYLPKPFNPTLLRARVGASLERKRLHDQVTARTRDLTEALERQTATSEVLRVISTSPGELEPVFQTMLAN